LIDDPKTTALNKSSKKLKQEKFQGNFPGGKINFSFFNKNFSINLL